jgi:hypothetical protein
MTGVPILPSMERAVPSKSMKLMVGIRKYGFRQTVTGI